MLRTHNVWRLPLLGSAGGTPAVRLRTQIVGRLPLLFAAVIVAGSERETLAQIQPGPGGISIDAEGVVRPAFARGQSAALSKKQRAAFADDQLADDVRASSDLRKVSLVRLEGAYAQLADAGQEVPAEMRSLAGLQRIDYVFIDPDRGDIVIAGPAEGFAPGAAGRMLGLSTARPTLRLDDLLAALRTVWRGEGMLGCSIDPETDRLVALQNYVRQNSSPTSSAGAKQRYREMARVLGMQSISLWGAPDDSHLAQVLVEADYRMKRISLGLEPSGVRGLPSHLSMITPSGNSMQRWWFVPLYEAIQANDDGTAFHLAGQRVQLLSQEEWVDAGGKRSAAAVTRASTQRFAQLFTERFEELARVSPVFAELQNVFDLAVTAALLRKVGAAQRVGWQAAVFLDPQRAPTEKLAVPRQVASEQMTRPARNGTMLGLVGGVTLDPFRVVSQIEAQGAAAHEVSGIRDRALGAAPPREGDSRWWWD